MRHAFLDAGGRTALKVVCVGNPWRGDDAVGLEVARRLKGALPEGVELADDALQWRCEQTIRNYDPCISCATHFLTLNVERG